MIHNYVTYVKPELDDIYPPGSIYISTSGTSPAKLFGGTWERIENQFLLAAGSAYMAGTRGGSADAVVVNHHHLLSNNWGDAEYMTPGYYIDGSDGMGHSYSDFLGEWFTTKGAWTDANNGNEVVASGVGKNMPPYLAVHMWIRTDGFSLISFDCSQDASFNFDNMHKFSAIEGMTWAAWISSSYNTEGFYIDENLYVRIPLAWIIQSPDENYSQDAYLKCEGRGHSYLPKAGDVVEADYYYPVWMEG